MVHKLPPVERANVILPEATLKLLDRNILNFVQHRAKLRQLGQSTRKGILLFHGPPGTGNTDTCHLASCRARPDNPPHRGRAGWASGGVHDPGQTVPAVPWW